jgi:hypothetical protein
MGSGWIGSFRGSLSGTFRTHLVSLSWRRTFKPEAGGGLPRTMRRTTVWAASIGRVFHSPVWSVPRRRFRRLFARYASRLNPAACSRWTAQTCTGHRSPKWPSQRTAAHLGLERFWRPCRTILVSNVGRTKPELGSPTGRRIGRIFRTLSLVHRQAENSRKCILFGVHNLEQRNVAFWSIDTPTSAQSSSS